MSNNAQQPWEMAAGEIAAVLSRVEHEQFAAVLSVFSDTSRRWFFSGQGRSGLVARMVAMRAMHIGRQAHVLGEATCPAITPDDGMVFFSGSGETPVTIHFAEIAHAVGATVVAVTHAPHSRIVELADCALIVPVQRSSQLPGNLSEQCSLVLMDSLLTTAASALEDPAATLFRQHTNMQ